MRQPTLSDHRLDRSRRKFRPGAGPGFLEVLEARALLTVTYQSIGPFSIVPQTGTGNPFLPYEGAIQVAVPSPGSADTIWAGTVNGGIWRTDNATSASPTWTAQTNQGVSLSIGALSLDPTDPKNLTLVAGIGRYSSFGREGGPLSGLLRTTDGGTTWLPIGQNDLAGKSVRGVIARGQTILAATDGGLYRSINGGTDFQPVTLDAAQANTVAVDDLVGDPGDAMKLFAASRAGIYMSPNAGASWQNVTGAATAGTLGALFDNTLTRAKLAVYDPAAGGNTIVYAGVINNNRISNVFRLDGTTNGAWVPLGLPFTTSSQGNFHFALATDPSNSNLVYIARADFGLFRGTYTGVNPQAPGPVITWTPLAPANGTPATPQPNADPRNMVVDRAGNLIEVDDGGINLRSQPTTDTGVWSSLVGATNQGIIDTELFSVAFDPVTKTVVAGAQDNGDPASKADGTWFDAGPALADGGYVQVDPNGVRYTSSQKLGNLNRRLLGDAQATPVGLMVNNADGTPSGMALPDYVKANNDAIPFYAPIALNAVDPKRLVIGTLNVYESSDQGDTLQPRVPQGLGDTTAFAYGGKNADGTLAPDILYVATTSKLAVRTAKGGPITVSTTYPGTGARKIVLDPNNWQTAFVLDQNNQVWRTTDGGATAGNWANLTGNVADPSLQALAFVPNPSPAAGAGSSPYAVLVGGRSGVYRMVGTSPGVWSNLTGNLPSVPVTDMQYSSAGGNDTLVLATLGRGVYQVTPFATINGAPNPDLFANPPTISPIGGVATAVGTAPPPVAFTVGGGATTPDKLVVTATSSNPGLVPNANLALGGTTANRTLAITPTANVAGTANITVSVSDGVTNTFWTFRFVAANVGTGPAFFPIPDQVIQQGTPSLVIPFKTQNIDFNTATTARNSSNDTLLNNSAVDTTAGTITFTPPATYSGSGMLTIIATVNNVDVQTTFRVTVLPNPQPATIQPVANQTTTVGAGKAALPLQLTIPPVNPHYHFTDDKKISDTPEDGGDAEIGTTDMQFLVDSSNPALLPADNIDIIEGDGGTFELDYTPVAGKSGSSTVTVTANSGAFETTTSFLVTVRPLAADLVLTSSPAPTGLVGQQLAYVLSVTNRGPDTATAATLRDTLPAGVTFAGASSSGSGPAPTVANGVVTANLGDLASGQRAVVTILVNPTAAGSLTDSATVASSTGDPNPGNNATQVVTTVSAPPVVTPPNTGPPFLPGGPILPPIFLAGHLNPLSDNGASSQDDVTNVAQPTFTGTALAGATVSVTVQAPGGPALPAGSVIADSSGNWSVTIGPLADGVYTVAATAISPSGFTSSARLTPVDAPLVIDTVAPTLTNVTLDPVTGRAYLQLQDDRSGLDPATEANLGNYALIGPRHTSVATGLVPPSAANGALGVSFNGGRALRSGRYLLIVTPGGIRDVAGNPLAGGSGPIVAQFTVRGHRASPAKFLTHVAAAHPTAASVHAASVRGRRHRAG